MSLHLCKSGDCDYVYPILGGDSIGNSLSAINLNFKQLDYQVCGVENEIRVSFNPALTTFSTLSANWNSAYTTLAQNSACWQNTFTTVSEMSGFWLSPITLVYPYPFTASSDIEVIRQWLNENVSPRNGSCMNYITGQVLYIFSPEYYFINRTASSTSNIGTKIVNWTATTSCISRRITIKGQSKVDCGSTNASLTLEDQFINKFIGIRYTLDSNLEWSNGTKIFE